MSLAHRIIPVLLADNGMLVKGKRFNSNRIVGNVQQAAEIHQARGVDEMIVLDVGVSKSNAEPDYAMIKQLTEKCFMPISVGGGIRSVRHIRDMLLSGADKVVIGSAAVEEPELVWEASQHFGSQAIVVAVDALFTDGNWFVTTRCGQQVHCYSAVTYARDIVEQGAGELVVTCVNNDGMMQGYDLGLIKQIAKAVDVPVIANGGCGSYLHMHRALSAGADAVAAGAAFQFLDLTPQGAADYLAGKGWSVRQ